MKGKDILRTEDTYAGTVGLTIKNDIIRRIEIDMLGHFGNIPSISFIFDNRVVGGYNDIESLGYILNFISGFFEFDTENGVFISTMRDIPCRLVATERGYGKVIAIGHSMKDKFFDVNLLHQLSE